MGRVSTKHAGIMYSKEDRPYCLTAGYFVITDRFNGLYNDEASANKPMSVIHAFAMVPVGDLNNI